MKGIIGLVPHVLIIRVVSTNTECICTIWNISRLHLETDALEFYKFNHVLANKWKINNLFRNKFKKFVTHLSLLLTIPIVTSTFAPALYIAL